jgi:hypothetical protein
MVIVPDNDQLMRGFMDSDLLRNKINHYSQIKLYTEIQNHANRLPVKI